MKAKVRTIPTFQAQMDHIKSSYQLYSDYSHLIHLFSQLSVIFCKVTQKAKKAESYTQSVSCVSRLLASEFPKGSNEELSTLSPPSEAGITPKPQGLKTDYKLTAFPFPYP